jgi:hypothetical protein
VEKIFVTGGERRGEERAWGGGERKTRSEEEGGM